MTDLLAKTLVQAFPLLLGPSLSIPAESLNLLPYSVELAEHLRHTGS
jgi:hypothetical protein